MAIFAASVFLTSCEQESILPRVEETPTLQQVEFNSSVQEYIKGQSEVTFNLPPSIEEADENTLQSYLADMTVEQIVEREDSYRIESFLGSLNRLDEVYEDVGQIDLFTLEHLEKYTSKQELTQFYSFEVSEINSRWCTTILSICVGYFRVWTLDIR